MSATYARPSDDVATTATTVTASAEDTSYPATNLVQASPTRPAKLTGTSGSWTVTLPSAQAIVAAAIIGHNYDEGITVTLTGSAPHTYVIQAPLQSVSGYTAWTKSPLLTFSTDTSATWVLSTSSANSLPVQVGRLMLFTATRTLNLAFMGDVIDEGHHTLHIDHQTELGVDRVGAITGPRRSLACSLIGTDVSPASTNANADDFRQLMLKTDMRLVPFLFVPFDTDDAWFVRFRNPSMPIQHRKTRSQFQWWAFDVIEESRGLPWP